MAKSTGKQRRGDSMHIESLKKDKFRSPGPHAGPKEHHIGHMAAPPDDYENGGETENETCENE